MNANTITPAQPAAGVVVAAFDETLVAERVAAFTAWGYAPADAIADADDYAAAGEHGLAAAYVEVARRLRVAEDADLVEVGHWGTDHPMRALGTLGELTAAVRDAGFDGRDRELAALRALVA